MAEPVKKKKRPTADKRLLQDAKKRLQNRIFKSRVRTATRTFEEGKSNETLSPLISLLDKGVKRGVYKPNKAARLKSKLMKSV